MIYILILMGLFSLLALNKLWKEYSSNLKIIPWWYIKASNRLLGYIISGSVLFLYIVIPSEILEAEGWKLNVPIALFSVLAVVLWEFKCQKFDTVHWINQVRIKQTSYGKFVVEAYEVDDYGCMWFPKKEFKKISNAKIYANKVVEKRRKANQFKEKIIV